MVRALDHGGEKTAKLPGRAGSYSEALPIMPLRRHFHCAWVNKVADDHEGPIAIVPDGCVDLLWRDERFLIVGPDATAAYPDLKVGGTILGLRFKPGAARHWLGLSMAELVGCEVEMADIWGNKARTIAGQLAEAGSDTERLLRLQCLLGDLPAAEEEPSRDASVIFGVVQAHASDPQGGSDDIRDMLGVSERTLRRRCHEVFGYGPKTLHRILRLQVFMAAVRRKETRGLGHLALAAGYADQAHMSREIRDLCGMTAGEFARQLV